MNITINAEVTTTSGEKKTGVELVIGITAADLSNPTHDILGYNGFAYPPGVAVEDRDEPIRIKGLHPAQSGPRGIQYPFGGQVLSTDFAYDVEIVGNKSQLTVISQEAIAVEIISNLATALSLTVDDFTVTA